MADCEGRWPDDAAKYQTPGGGIAIAEVDAIRGILVQFLRELDMPFPNPQYDHQFAQAACNEALRLGFPSTHLYTPEFQRAFQLGVAMCVTLYPHLSISRRYYICVYTACVAYLDNLGLEGATVVGEFNMLFLRNKKHMHPILDGFAILLRVIIEYDQQDMMVHTAATNYPGYLRYLTGIGRSFALFFFPPHIPLRTYVQIIPDMMRYIDDVNDIFSFYKEELAGETSNKVCLVARVRGCTKLEAMEHLAQVSIDGARRMAVVLEFHPEARALARKYLVQGYVGFHALSRERYKLDDLLLDDDKF